MSTLFKIEIESDVDNIISENIIRCEIDYIQKIMSMTVNQPSDRRS